MADDITISSTTDDADAVNAALDADPDTEPGDVDEGDGDNADAGDADDAGDGDESDDDADIAGDESDEDDTAAAAEDADTDADADAADDARSPRRRRKSAQDRIDQLVWERHQRDTRIAALEADIEALKAGRTAQPEADAVAPAVPEFTKPKPKLDNFETVEEWTEALTDWKAEKIQFDIINQSAAGRARIEADQRKREQETILADHTKRIEEFRKTHADFDAVARKATLDNVPITPLMVEHVTRSDIGPAILYHLAKHPDECRRIAALPNGPQLVALGEIQAELKRGSRSGSAPRTTKPKQNTRPAPPIRPVGRAASGGSTKDPGKMSYQEFKEWRRKQGAR